MFADEISSNIWKVKMDICVEIFNFVYYVFECTTHTCRLHLLLYIVSIQNATFFLLDVMQDAEGGRTMTKCAAFIPSVKHNNNKEDDNNDNESKFASSSAAATTTGQESSKRKNNDNNNNNHNHNNKEKKKKKARKKIKPISKFISYFLGGPSHMIFSLLNW